MEIGSSGQVTQSAPIFSQTLSAGEFQMDIGTQPDPDSRPSGNQTPSPASDFRLIQTLDGPGTGAKALVLERKEQEPGVPLSVSARGQAVQVFMEIVVSSKVLVERKQACAGKRSPGLTATARAPGCSLPAIIARVCRIT
ncbi:hypothetical protein WMY93_004002 [Mugilogobius chulae]|uniref:Uncharacterized protein n=1 Tax=Mugilogobius chulae TaxID=88201 RepID=A0AAW0PQV6_9GOBI